MAVIKERFSASEELQEKIYSIFGGSEGEFSVQTDLYPIIKVISEICDDTNGWIDWYIFEKGWGKKTDFTVTDNNSNILPSETLEDLWNLIQVK